MTNTWITAALWLTACGMDGGDPPFCVEPAFINGLEPDWAPCGCGVAGSEWVVWCAEAGNTCWGPVDPLGPTTGDGGPDLDKYGRVCAPHCSPSGECPPFMERETVCQDTIHCIIPCGAACPDGMYCSSINGCLYNFMPEP